MITTFTLDASLVGTIVGPPDGFITHFEMVTSSWPAWQADGWRAAPYPHGSFRGGGRLVLRDGDGEGIRIINFNPTFLPGPTPLMRNRSEHYLGGLMLESCPRGASYRLDLSDVDVPRKQWAS